MYRPTEELIPIEQTYPYLCGMLRGQLERALREIKEVVEDWDYQRGEVIAPTYLFKAIQNGEKALKKYEAALREREREFQKLWQEKYPGLEVRA